MAKNARIMSSHLGINGLGRIGKLSHSHRVGLHSPDEMVVNLGRQQGLGSRSTSPCDGCRNFVSVAIYHPSRHRLISNASCTTTCPAHTIKPLPEAFGVQLILSTVHAATGYQEVLDRLLAADDPNVYLHYADVPPQVTRVAVYGWSDNEMVSYANMRGDCTAIIGHRMLSQRARGLSKKRLKLSILSRSLVGFRNEGRGG